MNKIIIISIVYHEAEWMQTKRCIEATGLPVHYVHRRPAGVGSLAEAINRGYFEAKAWEYEYAWFVTNITFAPDVPGKLAELMDETGVSVLHPFFDSDHLHMRGEYRGHHNIHQDVVPVPFVEFTAAMVQTDIFNLFPLDEDMPYWGHDPDHGCRLWQQQYMTAVALPVNIGHKYIRHSKSPHEATRLRKQFRKEAEAGTKKALREKYGAGDTWRWMFPRDIEALNNYWTLLKEKL